MEKHRDTSSRVITRLIDAPVERVWEAWTNCEQTQRWWGPSDYSSPHCEIDLQEGGHYVLSMRAPEDQGGEEFYSAGTYERVVPLEHLRFVDHFSDAEGHYIDPRDVGMPEDMPYETEMEIDFIPVGECTELTITARGFGKGTSGDLYVEGMSESLDKLQKSLDASDVGKCA